MRRASGIARNLLIFVVGSTTLVAQDAPATFPVSATIDEPTIAGRAVALDAQHKLLPWPMPDDTGYSYAGYFLSQWTILWDQYDGAAIEIPRTGLRAGFDVYNAG
jgi:hypothetical protein